MIRATVFTLVSVLLLIAFPNITQGAEPHAKKKPDAASAQDQQESGETNAPAQDSGETNAPAQDSDNSILENALREAVKAGKCKVEVLKNDGKEESTISGQDCPVHLTVANNPTQTSDISHIKGDMKADYKLRDEKIKQRHSIIAFQMNGTYEGYSDDFKVELESEIATREKGKVNMALKYHKTQAGLEVDFTVETADFTVNLASENNSYRIQQTKKSGEAISQELSQNEFNSMLEGIRFPDVSRLIEIAKEAKNSAPEKTE